MSRTEGWVGLGVLAALVLGSTYVGNKYVNPNPSPHEIGKTVASELKNSDGEKSVTKGEVVAVVTEEMGKLPKPATAIDIAAEIAKKLPKTTAGGGLSSGGGKAKFVTYDGEVEAAEEMIARDKDHDAKFLNRILIRTHEIRMAEFRRKKTPAEELVKMEEDFKIILQKARVKQLERRVDNRQELLDATEELKATP